MRHIRVTIREKDKQARKLTLLNLREEVVNFLYRDTVANSTKADLQFYILIYFALIPFNEQSFLEAILDEGMPKFSRLNEAFAQHKGYLRAGEYQAMVNEYGLTELFQNDIFFVLVEAVLNVDVIENKFSDFYKNNPKLKKVIETLRTKYTPELRKEIRRFSSSKIEDDRYDDNGNYHDLSKSVYRTIRMRNSRNLDLNLQRYTDVKEITSQSPVVVEIIQHADPQIIFDLWEKYHVAEYMLSLLSKADHSSIASGVIVGLILRFNLWKGINGVLHRKDKEKARQGFEEEKQKNGAALDDLTSELVKSVLQANERREEEVDSLKKRVEFLENAQTQQDKEDLKKLQDRVANLENLEVEAKETDEDDETHSDPSA